MTLGIRWSRGIIPIRKHGAIWIMVGRPRKIGRRQPNGQLARAYTSPKAQVSCQPHRKVVVMSKYRDWPEAETEFGRLMLNGGVTPAQYEAGKQYAELAGRYRVAILAPRPNASGIDLERVGCGKGEGMVDSAARAIKRAYDLAFESCGPIRLQRLIAHHVVHDRPIDDFDDRKLLKRGLDKLVGHFGINPELALDRRGRISDSRT